MLISKGDREDAIHALINTWLKDKQLSCASCGESFHPLKPKCCDTPYICTNAQALKQFTKELEVVRQTRKNKYASLDDKSMRITVSLPATLYTFLDTAMRVQYGEKLFTKEYDNVWFAKKFGKYFGVPEEI